MALKTFNKLIINIIVCTVYLYSIRCVVEALQ